MPKLISIAVESAGRYVVIDSESHVWRGQGGQTPGAPMVITWEPVISEFASSGSPRFVGGPLQQEEEEEDELEP